MDLSIVIPVYNEENNVKILHQKIVDVCNRLGKSYEIIFVDDGSQDKTLENLKRLNNLKIICLRKNCGQTAAMDAGFKEAKGSVIITMDGDLQNDPEDIPKLLDKLDEGYDVVSGWRFERKDPFMKRFISRGANFLRKFFVSDGIHDSGCSLKAYRKECFDSMDLYGEMHRFIPAILKWKGFKIAEVKVSHHPRHHGKTKYGWRRIVKGFVDMISVWFWRKYSNRPLHLFGGAGLLLSGLGFVVGVYLFIARLFFGMSLQNRIWPLVSVFMVLAGIQLFVSGILADIAVKNYYSKSKERSYLVKEIIKK